MKDNKWVRLLAYITGMVNQRLLLPFGPKTRSRPTDDRLGAFGTVMLWLSSRHATSNNGVHQNTGHVLDNSLHVRFS